MSSGQDAHLNAKMDFFPSSPNWYCSSSMLWSPLGFVAISSRNSVILYNRKDNKFYGSLVGHTNRVTCLAMNNSGTLATGSVDFTLRIWDVELQKCTHICRGAHSKEITAVSISSQSDLVLSGNKSGGLITWRYLSTTDANMAVSTWTPRMRLEITSLKICPGYGLQQRELTRAAVAYQNGVIIIVDIETSTILSQLIGHSDSVFQLHWQPRLNPETSGDTLLKNGTAENPSGSDEKRMPLLVSTSRDRTVKVWEIPENDSGWGKTIKDVKVPVDHARSKGGNRQRLYVSAAFLNSSTIIFSGYSGDLFLLSLLRKPDEIKTASKAKKPGLGSEITPFSQGRGHSRIIFQICVNGTEVLTSSMDREIILWDINKSRPVYQVSSIGGYVYSLENPTWGPHLVIAGLGDNCIKVWNTRRTTNTYASQTVWKAINAKVISIAWHEDVENVVAYGTEDGKIGLVDISENKQLGRAVGAHRGAVWCLRWTRDLDEDDGRHELISCGADNRIYRTALNFTKSTCTTKSRKSRGGVNSILTTPTLCKSLMSSNGKKVGRVGIGVVEVAVHPSGKMLVTGLTDGTICLYINSCLCQQSGDKLSWEKKWRLVARYRDHIKAVTRMRWKPYKKSTDSISSYQLATTSDDGMVAIYKLENILKLLESDDGSKIPHPLDSKAVSEAEIKAVENEAGLGASYLLSGHRAPCKDIRWDPKGSDVIASAAYDGTIQLWNITKEPPGLANLRGCDGKLMSLVWTSGDLELYAGGHDHSIRRFPLHFLSDEKMRDEMQLARTPPHAPCFQTRIKQANKAVTVRVAGGSTREKRPKKQNSTRSDEIEDLLRAKRIELKEKLKSTQVKTQSKPEKRQKPHKTASKYPLIEEKRALSLLRKVQPAASASFSPLRSLVTSSLSNQQNSDKKSQVGGTSGLDLGITPLPPETNWKVGLGILGRYSEGKGGWAGVLRELEARGKSGALDDFWVGLSAVGGIPLWKATMLAYGNQLEKNGQYHEAAVRYLAVGKLQKTIEMYLNCSFYADAAALALSRLMDTDPLVSRIFIEWAESLERRSNPEEAAVCYSLGGANERAEYALKRFRMSSAKARKTLPTPNHSEHNEIDAGKKNIATTEKNSRESGKTLLEFVERVRDKKTGQKIEKKASWDPTKTAAVICDMWDVHWCKGATGRVKQLAPAVDKFVSKLRNRGVQIIHCPSGVVSSYTHHPARKRVKELKDVPTPVALSKRTRWGYTWYWPDPKVEPELPIDDSDGGCFCSPKKCSEGEPWTTQNPRISIQPEDWILDEGQDAWNVMNHNQIKNVLVMGVHLNMCVLGRPFAIRQLDALGLRVRLVRDLTDTMYNPEMRPYVSHFKGTEKVIEHVERHLCGTVSSSFVSRAGTDQTAEFRFLDL
ncbi:hypothetical protein AAMO2058_000640100 [Amorphochlora amoebiformis]